MDCNEVELLLPWWLTRTLEPDQEAAVATHLAGCAACGERLRQTRLAGDLLQGHLPVEAVVAHAFGDPVSVAQQELVSSHLRLCEQCRFELALVAESHRRLGSDQEAVTAPDEPVFLVVHRALRPGRAWRWAALAASVAAVAVGCLWLRSLVLHDQERSIWAEQQHDLEVRLADSTTRESSLQLELEAARRHLATARSPAPAHDEATRLRSLLEQQRMPRLNTLVLRLIPVSAGILMRGSDEPLNEIALGPPSGGTARVTLILLAEAAADRRTCRVELLDAGGAQVWTGSGLRASPENEFTLDLPLTLLPRPTFTLRVSEEQDGEHRQVAQYRVAVRDR